MSTEPPPLQPWQRPPFEPGNTLSMRHGAYSQRRQAERAEIVRGELLVDRPDLAAPEVATLVAAYARAIARDELASEALESGEMNSRLLESASSAGRLVKELATELGVGDRASAELREIRSRAALNVSQLAREAPAVLDALRRTLDALGLAGRIDEFTATFAAELEAVAGDRN